MSFRESIKADGKVKFTLTREDGTVKQIMVKNTVVDIGLNHILQRLASDGSIQNFGSQYIDRRYQIQTLDDGTTVTVDGNQAGSTSAILTSNIAVDSNELPLLITGSTIPVDTFITSKTGSTIVNMSNSHSGLTDTDVLSVGGTQFTDIGASANTIGTTFTVAFATVAATSIKLGHRYEILTVGSTDYTAIGADNSTIGTRFTATTVGTGTGTTYEIGSGTGTVRPATMSHMGVGSGTTAQTVSDSDLETELNRVVMGTENQTPPSITYSANFGAGIGTGTITEAAIFNAVDSDADMLCRTTFSAINKGASDTLEVQWIITITRS
jgi:hypothetical protein